MTCHPSMTAEPLFEMGRTGAEMLANLMNDQKGKNNCSAFRDRYARITLINSPNFNYPLMLEILCNSFSDMTPSMSIMVYAASFLLLFIMFAILISEAANADAICPTIFGIFR